MTDPPFDSRGKMEQFVLESLDEIITLLKTIDHPQRLRILALMIDVPRTFKELMEQTGLQKSALEEIIHLNVIDGVVASIEIKYTMFMPQSKGSHTGLLHLVKEDNEWLILNWTDRGLAEA